MAKLKNYNGRYCESEYESAFIAFLESMASTISPEIRFRAVTAKS